MSFDALVLLLMLSIGSIGLLVLYGRPRQVAGGPRRSSRARSRTSSQGLSPGQVQRRVVVETDTSEERSGNAEPLIPEVLSQLTLVAADDLDAEARENIDGFCHWMPEPQPIQRRIAYGLDDPEELVAAVSSDAGLTADVLRTVNSTALALRRPISSVHYAITYLGVAFVKGLVLQSGMTPTASGNSIVPAQKNALKRIWQSACVASSVAHLLGQKCVPSRPSELATRALFFNLGDVALIHALEEAPSWYGEGISLVQRIHAQQEAFSANAALVGAAVSRRWELPESLSGAIENAYLPMLAPPRQPTLPLAEQRANALVYLASRIGDLSAYQNLRNVSDVQWNAGTEADIYYLQAHLEACGLGLTWAQLFDPIFQRKVNRLLLTFSGR